MGNDDKAERQRQGIELFNRFSALADEGGLGFLSKMDVAAISYRLGLLLGMEGRLAELERALGDHGARGFACPHCEKAMTFCEKHGPYRRTDENQCPACRRGE